MSPMQALRRLWHRLSGAGPVQSIEPEWSPSRLIVGLGNPGPEYESTRHNVGFRVLQRLAEREGEAGSWSADRGLRARWARLELGGERLLLLMPQTFMNRSGESVVAALSRWPDLSVSSDLLVVYDDLDLPCGRIRLRPGGGAGGHRGMGDIIDRIGTRTIPRLRFGIGHPGDATGVVDWVLEPFSIEEEAELPGALDRACEAILAVFAEGLERAMGRFNQAASERGASPTASPGRSS